MSEGSESKTSGDLTVAELQKKLSRLRRKLKAARAETEAALATPAKVSPLAPKDGFPDLPVVGGVEFSAVAAGVKYSDRDDVMLARLAPGSVVAGVFTRSSTRSAPVLDCQQKLNALSESGGSDAGFALIVNSGNANAFTGQAGDISVKHITGHVAQTLDLPEGNILSASTGVIGEPLPHDRISATLPQLKDGLAETNAERAARAIMTTDTYAKGACAELDIDGHPVRIIGFAKGSGMIAPDMATMLAFVFTDAAIGAADLQKQVERLNARTFNAVSVDGDTSTSDSLIVAATGQSGAKIGGPRTATAKAFGAALGGVMESLAHQVVRDGEGATKFVEINVTGARGAADARKIARAIALSPLVKTAVAGEDPNWGRIVMAIGKSGARVERDRISISFGQIKVAENGWVSPSYAEKQGSAYMKQQDLVIAVDLGLGKGAATVWTCDFTKQYIAINADYRS